MSSAWDNQHRGVWRTLKGAARPIVTCDGRLAPRIRLSLDPKEARGVSEIPALRVGIDFGFCGPFRNAVTVAVDGREVKTALPCVVVHVNQSAHNRRLILRRAILPIPERLVAQIVLPLPIHRVAHTRISEDGTRSVKSVKTLRVIRPLEVLVAVAGAAARERDGGEPLCVASEGFL